MAATELTPKQRRCIAALVEYGDIKTAAKESNVSRTSVYVWLKTPAFQEALRTAEVDAIRVISRKLISLGDKALKRIEVTIDDPAAGASTQLRAALETLTRILEVRKAIDLEDRIAAIEERMSE